MIRVAAFLFAFGAAAFAWDPAGHMLAGEVAYQASSPEVRAKVAQLVSGLDQRFSGRQVYNFTTSGCWMDDMRSLKKDYAWSKWHYVEILKTPDASGFKLPEPPHVVWAVGNSLEAVRDPKTSPARQSEALGMLIHVVQDIHQPLHCGGWNDRGGNGYLTYGVAFADVFPGTKPNLHAFWDEAYRVEAKDGKIVESFLCPELGQRPLPGDGGIIAKEAAKIIGRFPIEKLATEVSELNPEVWARESYALMCAKAYPPGDQPSDTEVRTVPPEFAEPSREIAQKRIALAGYRLAAVLKMAFEK